MHPITCNRIWIYSSVLTFRLLPTFSYSDECRTKKAFKYFKMMLPLFRAVVKFCSTNSLFTQYLLKSLSIALDRISTFIFYITSETSVPNIWELGLTYFRHL